ncbi:MAG: globin [Gammaproteobacteria bacterium]|nr:MAG: globin [Gammaproteobacteria bacterium]
MKTEMFRPEIELFNDSLARCLRGGELFQRFYELFQYIALGWPECEAYLERIAVAHGKHGRDIAPHLYDLWLDCLLHAAKECDQQWLPEVEAAWRYMMGAGILFLKARYDRAPPAGGRQASR